MKRLVVLLVGMIFVFNIVGAYAAPVGNIATPKLMKKGLIVKDDKLPVSFLLEAEIDLTKDRKLKEQTDDTEYFFYGGKLGALFAEKVYLYGLFGAAKAQQMFTLGTGGELEWTTEMDTTWGGGATVLLYEGEAVIREKGMLRLGIDGRYRNLFLDVDEVKLNGTEFTIGDTGLTGAKFEAYEIQIGLAASYEIGIYVPYIGVKYSNIDGDAQATINDITYTYEFEPEDYVGIFAGVDILATDSLTLRAEGRFIDETAFSGGATLRF